MTTPERIWCQPTERRPVAAKDRKHAEWVRGDWKDHNSNAHGAREFVRSDLHDATKAQLAKAVEALRVIKHTALPIYGVHDMDAKTIRDVWAVARAVLAEIEKGGDA